MNSSQKHCRICVKTTTDGLNLFEIKVGNSDTLIVDFLRKLTNLEITDTDDLGDNLCQLCVKRLNAAFELIEDCISSDIILRQSKQNKKEESEIVSDKLSSHNEISDIETQDDVVVKPKPARVRLKCNECSKSFSKKMHLNVHLRSHVRDSDKKYVCKVCDKHFTYEYLLKQHEYKHTDNKPFPCKICNKGCLTAESLRRHLKIHDKNYVKKMHICKICKKELAYPSFLTEHMKSHTGEKPYLCSICGKGFRQVGALHYHQKIHTGYKPFECKICNQRFIGQSVLNAHMRKHTDERPYVCHICGMTFKQSTILKDHQRIHTGDKPILCPICGKRMSRTGQLTIHIRSHTGEKPYACSWCSKAFTTKTVLIKHERIHTGERPYVCATCGKSFRQSNSLKNHQNTHLVNKKRKEKEKPEANTMEISYNDENAVIYKAELVNLTNEIIEQEYMSENPQDIEVKTTDGSIKTHITVLLPAPIPFLQNL